MIYTYQCYDCGHKFDVEQSIKDRPLKKCLNPKCKHLSIERVIYAPLAFVKQSPTTLGQLADRNSKKLGKYEVSERDAKKKEDSKTAMAEAKAEMKKLARLTEKQKTRYIEDGKL